MIPPDGHGNTNIVRLTSVLEESARVLGQKSRQCCEFLVRQNSSLEGCGFDLEGKFARTALRSHCQHQIELALFGPFVLPHNHEVVRPRQNSHLWCEFWLIDVNIVELLHSPEVRGGESLEIWSLLRSHSDNSRTARWPEPPSATVFDRCAPTAQWVSINAKLTALSELQGHPCSDIQLLIVCHKFRQGRSTFHVDLLFVSQRTLEGNTAMRSNPVEFDLALIEKANQSWPRDIQKIGGLLGCEFRMKRNQLDCIAAAHLIQNLNEKMRGLGRDSDRWFFEGVDSAQIKRRGRTQAWSQNLFGLLGQLDVILRGDEGDEMGGC